MSDNSRPSVKEIKKNIEIIMIYVNNKIKSGEKNSFNIEKQFIKDHHDIYMSYPWIVKKICKREDLKPLFLMIKKLEDIENGKSTFKETEEKLGNALNNTYLKPTLDKLEKNDKTKD